MSSTLSSRIRGDAVLPSALFIAGSLVFLGAGRHHPHISGVTNPVGVDAFFKEFAQTMLMTPNWGQMHAMILLGPVLWALGAAGLVTLFRSRAGSLVEVGRAALLLGAGTWAVAFILDGFVGPVLARTIVGITDPVALSAAVAPFRISQLTMARLGMVSVSLFGAAVMSFSIALSITANKLSWRSVVGAVGVFVGLWPLVAAWRGEFSPGPFTSPYWTMTAVSLGLWFVLLATALLVPAAEEPVPMVVTPA